MAKQHRKGQKPAEESQDQQRRCIVQRISKPVDQLIRFVLDPENRVTPDLKRSLPGRGVWVTATRIDIDFAVEKGLFSGSFRQSVKTNPALVKQVEMLIKDRALKSLSLANKAGLVVAGFEKVATASEKREISAVFFASDGAEDGLRRMRQRIRGARGKKQVLISQAFLSGELGLALGREFVIHAALKEGGATQKCIADIAALERFLGKDEIATAED